MCVDKRSLIYILYINNDYYNSNKSKKREKKIFLTTNHLMVKIKCSVHTQYMILDGAVEAFPNPIPNG